MSDDDDNGKECSVYCSLGALTVEVEGSEIEEVESSFERIWEKRLDEAGEMSEALRDRMSGVE